MSEIIWGRNNKHIEMLYDSLKVGDRLFMISNTGPVSRKITELVPGTFDNTTKIIVSDEQFGITTSIPASAIGSALFITKADCVEHIYNLAMETIELQEAVIESCEESIEIAQEIIIETRGKIAKMESKARLFNQGIL